MNRNDLLEDYIIIKKNITSIWYKRDYYTSGIIHIHEWMGMAALPGWMMVG